MDYLEKTDNIHSNNVFKPNRRISKNLRHSFSRHCKLVRSFSRIQIEFGGDCLLWTLFFFNIWSCFYREDPHPQKQPFADVLQNIMFHGMRNSPSPVKNRRVKNFGKKSVGEGQNILILEGCVIGGGSIFPMVVGQRIFRKNGKLHNHSIKTTTVIYFKRVHMK